MIQIFFLWVYLKNIVVYVIVGKIGGNNFEVKFLRKLFKIMQFNWFNQKIEDIILLLFSFYMLLGV